jgi:integrase
MAFKTPNGTWRVTVRVDGRRLSRTYRRKPDADRFEYEARNGLLKAPGESMTFGEFAKLWLKDYAAVMKAETSALQDKSVIETHLDDAFGATTLTELTKADLRRLRGDLKGKLRPKTVNNILGLAKKMLKTAVEWDLIPANPWATIELLPVDDQPFDYWTAEERDKFLSAARFLNPKFAEVCLVAAHTGLRLGELRALQRDALNFEGRLIRVAATYSDHTKRRYERTKSRRVGYVPMNEAAYRVLFKRVLLSPDSPVFEAETLKGPCDKLGRLAKAVGVRPIRFHDLRHTFASVLVMSGEPIYNVSKLLRHASVSQTERYAHLAPAHLRAGVDRISVTDLSPDTGIATLR